MAGISAHLPSSHGERRQNGNQLRVRPYCDFDYSEVRDLFVVVIGTGTGSPCQIVLSEHLKKPTTYLSYAIFGVGLAISLKPSGRSFGMALAMGASTAFLGVRWTISKAFRDHCNMCLKTDLADIGNYYMSTRSTSTCKTSPQKSDHPDTDNGDASNENETSGSTGSGFWVVEDVSNLETSGLKKIVGCVGLGEPNYRDRSFIYADHCPPH